jgi:hypothetical protein
VIKQLLGQKNKDTLAFNQSSCCSEYLHLHALQSSRYTLILLASIIGTSIQSKQTSKLRTYTNQRRDLKESILKDKDRFYGRLMQKNTEIGLN